MIRTSIRWRLLAWTGVLVCLMLGGLGVSAFELMRRSALDQIDHDLARRVGLLAMDVRTGPGGPPGTGRREPPPEGDGPRPMPRTNPPERAEPRAPGGVFPGPRPGENSGAMSRSRRIELSAATAALFNEAEAAGPFFAVWSREGQELKRSANLPAEVTQPAPTGTQPGIKFVSLAGQRLAYYYTERSDCVLVGLSLAAHYAEQRRFFYWMLAAGVAVLGVGAGGGWWIVTYSLRPVAEISTAARRIAAGNLAERIQPSDPATELGHLAEVLNSTFARLETAFAEQRQFTADASHELRTPLTVIISEAQTALARPRAAEEYRETIETCLEAAQDLRRLAEQLLELARLDAGQGLDRRTRMNLAETVEACVALVRPLAEARGLSVETQLDPTPLDAEPGRIRQVVINLLDNAIHYNRERGLLRVSTRAVPGWAVVEVEDTGPGIAPEDIPHIFKRFYRASKARSATDGRTGLGLAIVHAIVEAHGGRVEVSSQQGQGSRFAVYLPA